MFSPSARWRVAVALLLGSSATIALPGVAIADAPAGALARVLPDLRGVVEDDGRVPLLVQLPPGRRGADLGVVEVVPGIGAAKLTRDEVRAFTDTFPEARTVTGPRKRIHLDRAGDTSSRALAYRQETGLSGRGVVVGVVDTGIDITHPAFRDPDTGKTRIAWLLSGGSPRGVHPEVEDRFGCSDPLLGPCAVWSAADLDEVIEAGDVPWELRDPFGHGTHVAGIAAGNGAWPDAHEAPDDPPKYVGIAPAATLVVAAPGSSGAFSDPDILTGTAFIFDRADALGQPAVVNLSLGGDFGPHDGTTLLEKGLASLVGDDRPGRAIVVSSGNSGTVFELSGELAGIHTEARVRPHASTRVPLVIAGRGSAYVWVTMRPGDDVSVGIEGPDGETWIDPIEPGDDAGYEGDDDAAAAVVNAQVGDKSDLTEDTNGAVLVLSKSFSEAGEEVAVVLEGEGDAQLWVTPTSAVTSLFLRGRVEGTVAVPATHPRLLAVGASISRTRWQTLDGDMLSAGTVEDADLDGIALFSACGPTATGVPKPELVAPGQFIASAMSVDADPRTSLGGGIFAGACPDDTVACLVVDEGYGISAGTSMASPLAAGAIALLMDRDPNLTQGRVADLLRAGARRFDGPVALGAQGGPGALDLLGALAALAGEEAAAGQPPDVAASWWTLSSSYARPDPTWPLHGIVQLRRADGTLASGLDGSQLALEVEGGIVTRGLTKLRHGTFEFIVAGRRGTAGTDMRVRVLYDGVAIGEEIVVPVGGDAFDATDERMAVGGCACHVGAGASSSPSGAPPGSPSSAWLLALLFAPMARRARRRGSVG